MSKSHVRELNQVYTALFQDAASAYPTLGTEFERDLTRLLNLVEHRGLRVYLLDLPAIAKHLDRCLANGEYKLSGLPLTQRYSNRVVIPKFLRGLYLLVFHENGCLKRDYDVQAIFFLRQVLLAAKKVPIACSDEKLEDAIQEFVDVDAGLPRPEAVWANPSASPVDFTETYHGFEKSPLVIERANSHPNPHSEGKGREKSLLRRLDFVSNFVSATLGSFDPSEWSFKHGPGAVSEVRGPANKYTTCWANWSDFLDKRFPISDYGFHNYGEWASRSDDARYEGVRGPERGLPHSRLVAVPKDAKGPRLIAAEPCGHQWCQQSLWSYFGHRCRVSWIGRSVRFRDQTINQDLCVSGSKFGSHATIDLSSASDRVTCHVVGQLFRANPALLCYLAACRTQRVSQLISRKAPELIELNKFCTMGSACTFPVESLIFFCIAVAAVLETRQWRATARNVRRAARSVAVYGDDIVIPVDCRESLFWLLEVLYFKVNVNKSFWTGMFRESCGVDSFGGVDVTPAYWKGPFKDGPVSLDAAVACSNNFYQKFLLNTSQHVSSTIPRVIPQVPMRSGVFGLKSRTRTYHNDLRGRWNSVLQRAEVCVGAVSSVQPRLPVEDSSALLQYFTEAPSPFDQWSSGVPQRSTKKFLRRWVPVSSFAVSETQDR